MNLPWEQEKKKKQQNKQKENTNFSMLNYSKSPARFVSKVTTLNVTDIV